MNRQIFTLTGDSFTITLSHHHHLTRHLKEKIQTQINTPIPQQIIYDNEKELENGDTIPPPDTILTLIIVSYPLIPDYHTLSQLVKEYPVKKEGELSKNDTPYGPMQHWAFDPSITSLSFLFDNWEMKREDTIPSITNWDTSHIHYMDFVFRNNTHFNQNIGGWDTSQVKSMVATFWGCQNFNQDLRYWQVDQTYNMSYLFRDCIQFNQDLTHWRPRQLIRASRMLSGCTHFQYDKIHMLRCWDPFVPTLSILIP